MSQAYEDCTQLFCVRCEAVGLDCSCAICGMSEEIVIDNTIIHMTEYHAIKPEEMTRRNDNMYENEDQREYTRTPLPPTHKSAGV